MSKFLKFIVNTFLIVAILVAVAILVPPLMGITTTIVDTPSMNTNLPLGSITYSTEIDVYEIKVGDEVLKESGSSTYAYIIREADPVSGQFTAVSATDQNGAEEQIILRNNVPRVAVVVPYIGYVLIAMHSVEGIIIIGLVVVLMVILFILSELWKPISDEDDEDEEDYEEEMPKNEVVASEDENGIDTDVIKAAVAENTETVQAAAEPAAEDASIIEETAEEAAAETETADDTETAAAEEAGAEEPEERDPILEEAAAYLAGDTAEAEQTAEESVPEEEVPADSARETAPEAAEAEAEAPAAEEAAVPSEEAGDALEFTEIPVTEEYEEDEPLEVNGRFIPVSRPTLGEIEDAAKAAGAEPSYHKDDVSGITVADYSKLL